MADFKTGSRKVIEHPVFFNMPGLCDHPEEEGKILQGLHDLQFSKFSDLHFLYTGRVIQSRGLNCTHALVSRFPSVEALTTYYDLAIKDVAKRMIPWLKGEFCVDYETWLPDEEIILNDKSLAFLMIFIKVNSNTSPTDIDHAIKSFLGLDVHLDYPVKLTAGENLYTRSYYKTKSHAFTAYLPSVEALEKFQKEAVFLSVLEGSIFPIAETYVSVSFIPHEPQGSNL